MNYFLYLIFLLATFFSAPFSSFCQTNFTLKYSTPEDEIPFDVIQISDGYIVCAKKGTYYPSHYNTLFLKLNESGDTISSLTINTPNNTTIFDDLIKLSDSTFYSVGIIFNDTSAMINLLKMNNNLDIISNRVYETGIVDFFTFRGILTFDDKLVIYGSGYQKDSIREHPFIFCFDQNGDSLFYNYYHSANSQRVGSMIEKDDSSGYIMAISGRYQIFTNSSGQFLTFNNFFEVSRVDSLPQNLRFYYDLKPFDKNHFLLTGERRNSTECKLAIYKYDSSMVYSNHNFLGFGDTLCYPGYLFNLDFIDTNNVFMGGTVNQDVGGVFSSKKSFYFLSQFDSDLNVKWERYYGGDMYYSLWCMHSTNDGGAILLGTTYDYLNQVNERDIYIIKVDSDGLITGTNDSPLSISDVCVYPNPGNDYFIVKTSPELPSSTLIVRNIYGQEILKIQIKNIEKIDMSGYSSGFYFWEIISNGKTKASGKWIKI